MLVLLKKLADSWCKTNLFSGGNLILHSQFCDIIIIYKNFSLVHLSWGKKFNFSKYKKIVHLSERVN